MIIQNIKYSFDKKTTPQKKMDPSTLQAQVDALTATVATDQTTLSNDEAALATAKAELGQVTLINQLEALTADDITAINAGLLADAANNPLGLSLALPTPTAAASPDEAPQA